MQSVGTWSALRALRRTISRVWPGLRLASEANCKCQVAESSTEAAYVRVNLQTGKNKESVEEKEALVYLSPCSDVIARDLNRL